MRALLISIHDESATEDVTVVFYSQNTGAEPTRAMVGAAAGDMAVRTVATLNDLLFATALYLHRVPEALSEDRRRVLEAERPHGADISGKSVLIVDDDVRNVFALTSVLEQQGVIVRTADSGKRALEILQRGTGIDVVLMDIMMPDMDGYEAIRAIRAIPAHRKLPILAVTAKAMKDDREKCIAAGASDYLAKPVNAQKLVSALRIWIQA
jgi:CheY-like chemotaxis protein